MVAAHVATEADDRCIADVQPDGFVGICGPRGQLSTFGKQLLDLL